ncbi:hypothetical transcript [Echinococcus multilocularis]|uniref:Hypothetical transcript n=1 Tax=Echinococcus multilocularis TaxID=6211 RepID=A0A068Y236_ECHMU|nr:hypothetical transcript [Echinococcus multilocularis]
MFESSHISEVVDLQLPPFSSGGGGDEIAFPSGYHVTLIDFPVARMAILLTTCKLYFRLTEWPTHPTSPHTTPSHCCPCVWTTTPITVATPCTVMANPYPHSLLPFSNPYSPMATPCSPLPTRVACYNRKFKRSVCRLVDVCVAPM